MEVSSFAKKQWKFHISFLQNVHQSERKPSRKWFLLPGRSSSFPRDVLLADILLQLLWYSNLLWWIVGCSQGHFLLFFLFFSFFYRQTKKKTITKWKREKSCTPLSLIESHNGHNDVTVGHHVPHCFSFSANVAPDFAILCMK